MPSPTASFVKWLFAAPLSFALVTACTQQKQQDPVPLIKTSSDSTIGLAAVLRYYNHGSHFYSTSRTSGAPREGVAFYAYETQAPGTSPFYALYIRRGANYTRLYTINASERAQALANGWVDNGVQVYVNSTQVAQTKPLYRLRSPNGFDYLYTTNDAEVASVTANLGYVKEGVSCWVY